MEESSNAVAALFCAHFLPRDQNHVYRQVDGLPQWSTQIFTWKRDCVEQFPFPEERITLLEKPWTRELSRFWNGCILRGKSWRISGGEVRNILAQLEREQAQLLHVYFGHVAVHLLPLLKKTSLPVVVSFHGVDAAVAQGSLQHKQLLEVFSCADVLLARSEELLACLQKLGAATEKLRLWRTGIPLEDWQFESRLVPENGEWQFAQACRFQQKKGLDLSLRVFAKLRQRWPQSRLVLAGDGPCKQELLALAEQLGVADAVEWPGFLDQAQLKQLYAKSHLLLHPSRTTIGGDREGVPNAMLEAMATGLPVAATLHGGIPEALAGTEAILASEEQVDVLVDKVLALLEEPSCWQELGKQMRSRIEEGFSLVNQRNQLASLYQECQT